MTVQRRQTRVSLTDIAKALEKGVDDADLVRSSGLHGLQRVRAVKLIGLQREHARLSHKLGPDHPRVVALAQKLQVDRILVQQLGLEARRASTELPPREESAWVLHGYVHDKDFVAIPNHGVALYDHDGQWLEQLGHPITNRYGYFKLVSRNLKDYTDRSVYIHVLDNIGTHLYADKNPVKPGAGSEDYREITVTDQTKIDIASIPNATHPIADREHWVARGRVTDTNDQGVGGLTVSVFDEGHAFDERLGQVETDDQGYYMMTYRVEDCGDLMERNPDLYLKVFEEEGEPLYSSKEPFRFQGGRAEILNVSGVSVGTL